MDSSLKKLKHKSLMSLVHIYAPKLPEGGVCNGVTSMWLQAVLTGVKQEVSFYTRFDFFSNYLSDSKNNLEDLAEEINDIYVSRQKDQTDSSIEARIKRKMLTSDELAKIELRGFAESVALQQDPHALKIFDEPISQENKSTLYAFTASKMLERGFNLRPMSELPENKKPEQGKMYIEKIGDKLKYMLLGPNDELIQDFLDVSIEDLTENSLYNLKSDILNETSKRQHTSKISSNMLGTIAFSRKRLISYFNKIKQALVEEQKNHPNQKSGFLLSSDNHTVGVCFDFPSGKWHFFDVNQLGEKKEYYFSIDSTELAPLVFTSLFDETSKSTVFNIQHVSNYTNENLVSSLKEINNKSLIKSRKKVNARGFNTLTLAAYMGDVFSVNALLQAKVEINSETYEGWTPLLAAAENGKKDMVKLLLMAVPKANINAETDTRWTALMLAAKKGHNDIVKLLLDSVPKANINAKNNTKWTALMFAVDNGNLDTVEALLTADPKANINDTNENGATALILAADSGNTEMVKLLLFATPKPNLEAKYKNSLTALMLAAEQGHTDTVKALLSFNPKLNMKALMLAAFNGHTDTIKALLEADPNPSSVNIPNEKGMTALMLAAQNGHTDTVKALLDSPFKKEINVVDNADGWTALMMAIDNNHLETVKALLEADPKPNLAIENKEGETALDLAIAHNNVLIIKVLKYATLLPSSNKVFLPAMKFPSIPANVPDNDKEKPVQDFIKVEKKK
jgi:ankyrin repeat protein